MAQESPPQEIAVDAQNLRKQYQKLVAVDNVSLQIRRGTCVGILGPNGAGKTTLLHMMIGAIPPNSGSLTVLGYAMPQQAPQMRFNLGVVPQFDALDPDFDVTNNLKTYARYFGIPKEQIAQRIQYLLEFASLEDKKDVRIFQLSGGMRRRLSLARSLINSPSLVILDEPTTGLDPQARHDLWEKLYSLKKQGVTLILSTHYMEEAERLCDSVIIMDKGKILAQAPPLALIQKHIEPTVTEVFCPDPERLASIDKLVQPLCTHVVRLTSSHLYYGKSEVVAEALSTIGNEATVVTRRANLEDVFLRLTGRELRDA